LFCREIKPVKSLLLKNTAMMNEALFELYNRFIALDTSIIYNVANSSESDHTKRALLLYVVRAFRIEENDPLFLLHHGIRRCRIIAGVLEELGFIVDVAHAGQVATETLRDYDLIISDSSDLRGQDLGFRENAKKVFLATGYYNGAHNRSLTRRHDLLFERRSCRLKPKRMFPDEISYVEGADALIGVGNRVTVGAWREAFQGPIYPFNNCGFKETRPPLGTKDIKSAGKGFLFFASRTQILKGLDLLLEIFPKHPDLRLYVCSPFELEGDFCNCYRKELYETSNVHPIGWVTVNSREFYELIDRCAYVIHPSCSEGQPGSVVQCMYAGLIPLVTKEAGIDTEDFGVTFKDDSLEEIENAIVEASRRSEDWLREHSGRTRKVALEKYSEDALRNRWRDILTEITAS